MMSTGLVLDERFCEHETGWGHPERPDRLRAIGQGLRGGRLMERLVPIPAQPADLAWIRRLHRPEYIDRLRGACEAGEPYIDVPDSAICPVSYEIALLAVGGVLAAVDQIMAGSITNAFCAVRPPGHHAEANQSMGFCLFNNVAIAAEYWLARHGLKRVAIVDFDVHHGNGTQHLFEHRNDVLFISLHQDPSTLYPGTGFASEQGTGEGEGYTLNIPMWPNSTDEEYQEAFKERVLPTLNGFEPQALLISAGFDAAKDDPLAHLALSPQGFAWMTRQLKAVAGHFCRGRLLSVLEGGYDLISLAECVNAHVGALLEPPMDVDVAAPPSLSKKDR